MQYPLHMDLRKQRDRYICWHFYGSRVGVSNSMSQSIWIRWWVSFWTPNFWNLQACLMILRSSIWEAPFENFSSFGSNFSRTCQDLSRFLSLSKMKHSKWLVIIGQFTVSRSQRERSSLSFSSRLKADHQFAIKNVSTSSSYQLKLSQALSQTSRDLRDLRVLQLGSVRVERLLSSSFLRQHLVLSPNVSSLRNPKFGFQFRTHKSRPGHAMAAMATWQSGKFIASHSRCPAGQMMEFSNLLLKVRNSKLELKRSMPSLYRRVSRTP